MLPTACPKCHGNFVGPDGYRSMVEVRGRMVCLPCAEGTSVVPVVEVVTKAKRKVAR